jgi:hypothetical protein
MKVTPICRGLRLWSFSNWWVRKWSGKTWVSTSKLYISVSFHHIRIGKYELNWG